MWLLYIEWLAVLLLSLFVTIFSNSLPQWRHLWVTPYVSTPIYSRLCFQCYWCFIWNKVFKNGPSGSCGIQPFKKFHLVHSWILYPIRISNAVNHNSIFLAHFMPLVSFYTPRKRQKTKDFLMFSGGIERDQWHEMG